MPVDQNDIELSGFDKGGDARGRNRQIESSLLECAACSFLRLQLINFHGYRNHLCRRLIGWKRLAPIHGIGDVCLKRLFGVPDSLFARVAIGKTPGQLRKARSEAVVLFNDNAVI